MRTLTSGRLISRADLPRSEHGLQAGLALSKAPWFVEDGLPIVLPDWHDCQKVVTCDQNVRLTDELLKDIEPHCPSAQDSRR